jgi:hypothetical protein
MYDSIGRASMTAWASPTRPFSNHPSNPEDEDAAKAVSPSVAASVMRTNAGERSPPPCHSSPSCLRPRTVSTSSTRGAEFKAFHWFARLYRRPKNGER